MPLAADQLHALASFHRDKLTPLVFSASPHLPATPTTSFLCALSVEEALVRLSLSAQSFSSDASPECFSIFLDMLASAPEVSVTETHVILTFDFGHVCLVLSARLFEQGSEGPPRASANQEKFITVRNTIADLQNKVSSQHPDHPTSLHSAYQVKSDEVRNKSDWSTRDLHHVFNNFIWRGSVQVMPPPFPYLSEHVDDSHYGQSSADFNKLADAFMEQEVAQMEVLKQSAALVQFCQPPNREDDWILSRGEITSRREGTRTARTSTQREGVARNG